MVFVSLHFVLIFSHLLREAASGTTPVILPQNATTTITGGTPVANLSAFATTISLDLQRSPPLVPARKQLTDRFQNTGTSSSVPSRTPL